MNKEFVEKMIEAKKIERDALLSLLNLEQNEHITIIEKEIMALLKELVSKEIFKECTFQYNTNKKQGDFKSKRVQKINID